MRSFVAAAAVTLALPLALASPLAKRSPGAVIAPLREEGEQIDDAYIVVLKKDVTPAMMAFHLGSVEESNGVDVSELALYWEMARNKGSSAVEPMSHEKDGRTTMPPYSAIVTITRRLLEFRVSSCSSVSTSMHCRR